MLVISYLLCTFYFRWFYYDMFSLGYARKLVRIKKAACICRAQKNRSTIWYKHSLFKTMKIIQYLNMYFYKC
uniref:Uncharacterized protein n=1 Tax=Ciona intestinalis TaxID=7719 RepID=H2XUB2_CIOIN